MKDQIRMGGSMRKCGECAACCTIMGVPDLKKPKATKCVHMKASGTKKCSIYTESTKPKECETFSCLWLEGLGSSKDRPDRSGLMFITSESRVGFSIVGFEVWFDAGAQARSRHVVTEARALAKRIQANLLHRRFDPGEQT